MEPDYEETDMADEINLISEIREAERRAEEMIASARGKGEAMIEKIRDEYREKTILAESDFRSGREGGVERAKADAEKEALRISDETEREIARIKIHAGEKKQDAALFLIRKILE